jgi:hypothetical protein
MRRFGKEGLTSSIFDSHQSTLLTVERYCQVEAKSGRLRETTAWV